MKNLLDLLLKYFFHNKYIYSIVANVKSKHHQDVNKRRITIVVINNLSII